MWRLLGYCGEVYHREISVLDMPWRNVMCRMVAELEETGRVYN
jgi:hypothetical protein